MNLESKIESILFFKNEPTTLLELSKILNATKEDIRLSVFNLQKEYKERGIVVVTNGEEVSLGTHPSNSNLIEKMQKEEFSRELGRAGLETLAVILYRGPVSRREIDHIRGVNSSFILRTLMIRGLIERADVGGRGYSYKATLRLLEHLGVTRLEDLPEFGKMGKALENFIKESEKEEKENAE